MPPQDALIGHLLYTFRFRDRETRKWVRTRYKAERHVIAEGYAERETIVDTGTPTWVRP